MNYMSIYPTINKPVIISEKRFDAILDSFRKEQIQEKVFLQNEATACLWQSLSLRIANEIEANMELSESAGEIAKAIISNCSGLHVESLKDNMYEISSERSEANTWLVEKESGEIFLCFSSNKFVDITEMGPETAAIFVGRVFGAFEDIIVKGKSVM